MKTIFYFLFIFVCCDAHSQTVLSDSAIVVSMQDTIEAVKLDTSFFSQYLNLSSIKGFVQDPSVKVFKYDIEYANNFNQNQWLFVWIFFALIYIAIVRVVYWRQFQEYALQAIQLRVSPDSYKISKDFFSFFSLLLLFFAIVNIAIILAFLKHTSLYSITTVAFLFIILFTLFISFKLLITKVVTLLLDEIEIGNFYISTLVNIVQTIGIAMFPAVMFIAVLKEVVSIYLIFFTAGVAVVALLAGIIRWLSTIILLMYKSLYHFLLYICIAEILVVFLFFKFLTKIAF